MHYTPDVFWCSKLCDNLRGLKGKQTQGGGVTSPHNSGKSPVVPLFSTCLCLLCNVATFRRLLILNFLLYLYLFCTLRDHQAGRKSTDLLQTFFCAANLHCMLYSQNLKSTTIFLFTYSCKSYRMFLRSSVLWWSLELAAWYLFCFHFSFILQYMCMPLQFSVFQLFHVIKTVRLCTV